MAYTEEAARRLIIQAGHELVEKGLVTRTWGNISARISDDSFLITPSGRDYETLQEHELVKVNISDLSYDKAEGKPSSEKGIHAAAYRLRKDANFIIHTHQYYASAIGASGKDFSFAPLAAYGLPGTKKLMQAVELAISTHPMKNAFLMQKHGALCLGRSCEDAFSLAETLEQQALAQYRSYVSRPTVGEAPALGSSFREGDHFVYTCEGETKRYPIEHLSVMALPAVKLHAALYRRDKAVQHILPACSAEVLYVSETKKALHPYLDDFAQIAGETVRVAELRNGAKAIRGRNAVLVKGAGALCTGATEEDADAVRQILRKNVSALRYCSAVKQGKPLSAADALLQRTVYLTKYSKKK